MHGTPFFQRLAFSQAFVAQYIKRIISYEMFQTVRRNGVETAGKPRLVFVGGGHVHVYSLKYADRFVRAGVDVVLIGPDRFHYYSGMGPGMLSRIYEPRQVRFDIQTMIESQGGKFIRGRVASVDPSRRHVVLETGEEVPYDVVSFNVGSYVPMDLVPGAADEAYPVKPIERLEDVRGRILERVRDGIPKILVIGAGPAGVELAGNVWRLVTEHNGRSEITIASSRDDVLPAISRRARECARRSLVGRGIRVLTNYRVASMRDGVAISQAGDSVAYDIAVLTIGIRPKGVFAGSGLDTADDGSLLVNEYLQSTSHPDVFGGGDCIAMKGRRIDRVGVYAVREAPILFLNLMARLNGDSLKAFIPQARYLLIFNLGDGNGLLVRHPVVIRAKWAFAMKDYIDRKFMSKYQISEKAR